MTGLIRKGTISGYSSCQGGLVVWAPKAVPVLKKYEHRRQEKDTKKIKAGTLVPVNS